LWWNDGDDNYDIDNDDDDDDDTIICSFQLCPMSTYIISIKKKKKENNLILHHALISNNIQKSFFFSSRDVKFFNLKIFLVLSLRIINSSKLRRLLEIFTPSHNYEILK
jgi:hypothetical protein